MSNPSLQPILTRLSSTAQYRPFSAETFADWASEAGDTVQISRDGTTYSAPIHKQTISWHGAHKVTMESGGTKDREAMQRTSNRKYKNTSAGVSSQKANQNRIAYDFYSSGGMYHAQIRADAESFETIYTKTGINDLGQSETLYSKISQQADKISLVVTEEQGENVVNRASIILAINGEGGSSIHIDASEVYIGNQSSTTVINGKLNTTDLTAELIQAKLLDAVSITVNSLTSNSSLDANQIFATYFYVDSGGYISTPQINLNNHAITNCLVSASVANNTLTLTYADGTSINFSKAVPSVVLTGAWSGDSSSGYTFTVTNNINSSTSATTITRTMDANWSASYQKQITISATNKQDSRLWQWYVDASSVYDDGYASARISAITWGGTSGNTGHVEISTTGATSRDFTVRASAVGITYNSSTHKYTGNVQALVSGTERHSVSYDSGTQAFQDGGVVTGFSTTAPADETYSNYTNGADGYQLSGSGSSANAYIVVKGTITTAGGGQQTKDYYLQSAPTKLYRKGYSDGTSSFTQVRDGGGNENFIAYYYNSTYGRYESLGSHKWYYK